MCILPIKVLFEADTQQSLSPLPCLFRPDQPPAGTGEAPQVSRLSLSKHAALSLTGYGNWDAVITT